MKKYSFTKFDGFFPRGDAKIAINKSGLIRLSRGFRVATNTTNFKYVILYYDSVNKAIALRFANTRESGALNVTKDRTSATVSAKTFMKANNLNLRSYFGRYDWKKQKIPDIGQVFIIELNKK